MRILYTVVCMALWSCQLQEPSRQQSLTEDLEEQALKSQLHGMSVVLIKSGKVIYNHNYGFAQPKQPITNHTKFRIASISKLITSVALMQLVEKNMVDLDEDISEYLGWKLFNPKYPQTSITLRLLLSHQSSIRDGIGYSTFLHEMHQKQLDLQDLFTASGPYYTSDMFADESPGTSFSYSNAAWGIVATVIEIQTRVTFDKYCRQNIFDPMGIAASYNVNDIALEHLSPLYRFEDDQWTTQVDDYQVDPRPQLMYPEYYPGKNGSIYAPQGGLRCSAMDLSKLALMFMNKGQYRGYSILQMKSIKMMSTPQWKYDGSNGDTWNEFFHSYGLGVHVLSNKEAADVVFPGWKMIGHAGIAYGLLSDMYFDPETKSGIVFITNGSKKPIEYGSASSFYQVEEEIFKICHLYLKDS